MKAAERICRYPDQKAIDYHRADLGHYAKRRKVQRQFALYNSPDQRSVRAVLRGTTDTAARRNWRQAALEKLAEFDRKHGKSAV